MSVSTRDAIRARESIQQRHLYAGDGRPLAEIDAACQPGEAAPVRCVSPLNQLRAPLCSRKRRSLCFTGAGCKGRAFSITPAAVLEGDSDEHIACIAGASSSDTERLQQWNS
ncbi:MAG: hypothetical protein AUH05_12955 [Ktedonobacter sp. 13_2_20CM_53_11]|nr:MAG: hypothetical protein AUH05_12955 [Ktedonobacter sp. 13_2_20CM_53_11]